MSLAAKQKLSELKLKNLKSYKKGQSGNPKGRPKKIPELKILLAETLDDKNGGITAAKAIFLNLRNMAITRKDSIAIRAAELLLAYAYGRPKQQIDAEIKTVNIDRAADDVQTIATEYALLDAAETETETENAD